MTSATAAAPVRLGVAATLLVALVAVVVAGRAESAPQAWSASLAPADTCAGADDRGAAAAAQRRSVRCLVNWARVHAGQPRLRPSRALRRAAVIKGQGVASCRQLSHTPCNSAVTDAVRRAGYRYSTFGENLFAGMERRVSPRDVVGAWLDSPGHRANILRSGFRELGLAGVQAQGLLGDGTSVVWVAAFGAPR